MKFSRKYLLWIIIIFEIVGIIAIGVYIYLTLILKKNVLGISTSVSPISKETVNIQANNDLKYFFEFKPGTPIIQSATWIPKPVTYTINSDSLNERYDYNVEKSADTIRVITLGDSFTFGQYVNTDENWPERLEDKLNNNSQLCKYKKFEVINLGMPDYGVEYIKYRYELRGKKYNPDMIIWFESGTGFDRINEWYTPLVEKYLNELNINEQTNDLNNDFYPAARKALDEMAKQHSNEQILESAKKSWETFLDLRENVPVLVMTDSDNVDSVGEKILDDWFKNKKNITIFNKISLKTYGLSLKDRHPSQKGHEYIANNIFNYLKTNLQITCPEKK